MKNKFNIEKMKVQRQLLLRRNKALYSITNDYDELSDKNKNYLREIILLLFSRNRLLEYDKVELISLVNQQLYPEIDFVALSKIYSKDDVIQISFLEKMDDELHYELSRNRYFKTKIKIK